MSEICASLWPVWCEGLISLMVGRLVKLEEDEIYIQPGARYMLHNEQGAVHFGAS